jgi:cysteine-rich repeat protein
VSSALRRSRLRDLTALGALLGAPACLSWADLQRGACGDGFVGREESCDDGNRTSGDGCSDDCRIEPDVCGDGRKAPSEGCDDANESDTDACLSGCVEARCGDGQQWDSNEECDDGNTDGGDGCSAQCTVEMVPAGPSCGDGNLDDAEACDDGNQDRTDSCSNGCSFAVCGDGVVRRGVEECDDAGITSTCTRACTVCEDSDTQLFRKGNGHCYTLHPQALSQQKARAACQSEGGELWTVTSEDEGSDVSTRFSLGDAPYWLGLTTTGAGPSWVTGESTKYTGFGAGEPTASVRCVAFTPGGWRSEACAAALPFVCERAPAFISQTDHHAYRIFTGPRYAPDARALCEESGGHLAALETNEERLFVGKNVGIVVWVDATDAAEEGRFVWPNGAAVEPAAYAGDKPNDPDGTRGCLVMNPGDKYADARCDEPHAYLCEYD